MTTIYHMPVFKPMPEYRVNDRVMFTQGQFRGNVGTVVAVLGGRLKVKWDDGKESSAYIGDLRLLNGIRREV